MSQTPYAEERRIAIQAVRQAATVCRAVQSRITPDVLEKKDKSPVTVADFGSQAVICRQLRAAFADDPIIGEEDAAELRQPDQAPLLQQVVQHVTDAVGEPADAASVCQWIDFGGASDPGARLWTLDPIDGTKGFLRKQQYAISLALLIDGEVTVAAVGCPNLGEQVGDDPAAIDPRGTLFVAVRGQGAVALPLDADGGDDAGRPVTVSATTDPAAAKFCESVEAGHSSHDDSAEVARRLNITAPGVRLDSQAKYVIVGRGEADIYMRLPTRPGYVEKIWDHAGGALVVEEAGGKVTDVHGKPLEFQHGSGLVNNTGVIVTNGRLHDAVIEALGAVGVGR